MPWNYDNGKERLVLATAKQADTLDLIGAGGYVQRDGKVVRPEGSPSLTSAALSALVNKGWVGVEEDGTLSVTESGRKAVIERRAIDSYKEDPNKYRIGVRKRHLGRRAWGASVSAGTGRDVTCFTCFKRQREEAEANRAAGKRSFSPDPVVWFTNEGGAQREAEVEAALHHYRHEQGEIG